MEIDLPFTEVVERRLDLPGMPYADTPHKILNGFDFILRLKVSDLGQSRRKIAKNMSYTFKHIAHTSFRTLSGNFQYDWEYLRSLPPDDPIRATLDAEYKDWYSYRESRVKELKAWRVSRLSSKK